MTPPADPVGADPRPLELVMEEKHDDEEKNLARAEGQRLLGGYELPRRPTVTLSEEIAIEGNGDFYE